MSVLLPLMIKMLPQKTQIQVEYLESNRGVVGVFGGIELIDKNNQITEQRVSEKTEYGFNDIILNHHDLPTLTQDVSSRCYS